MTKKQYDEVDAIRREFKDYAASLTARLPWLGGLQEALRISLGYDDYRIETPVVYNEALDDLSLSDKPRFIIVADNPGKNEQKAANRRYLVGQSGKLAQGWFLKELGLDFRTSSLIINKTPIHTPKTAEIGALRRLAAGVSAKRLAELDSLLDESQRTMAGFAFRLHACLGGILWISGYGELKPKGLFAAWTEEMTRLYRTASPSLREKVWVFRHFSMNQFAIEYKQCKDAGLDPLERLALIGTANRRRILGW
ncbi:MAG: hypothetical protein CVV53_01650 [Spirochaetae bacterium HGW-Spirochaetae-9]|nr:MAG: hypothetical protein CVV53_01650 [Spirochaetae bacterium HGW-Spirochaetae-9]